MYLFNLEETAIFNSLNIPFFPSLEKLVHSNIIVYCTHWKRFSHEEREVFMMLFTIPNIEHCYLKKSLSSFYVKL